MRARSVKWLALLMMAFGWPMLTGCLSSRAISRPSMPRSVLSVHMAGAETLLHLRQLLSAQGVELSLQVDPMLLVFSRGDLALQELPALIELQTGMAVEVTGERWVVRDMDGAVGSSIGIPGKRFMSIDERSRALAVDRAWASAPRYIVEFRLVEASVAVSAAPPAVSAGADLGWLLADLCCVADQAASFEDGETTFQQNFTVLQNTPALQSSESSRTAGLLVAVTLHDLGGSVGVDGTFELSTLESASKQSSKRVSLPAVASLGSWVPVCSLSRADASLRLKPLGVSVGGSSYRIEMRITSF